MTLPATFETHYLTRWSIQRKKRALNGLWTWVFSALLMFSYPPAFAALIDRDGDGSSDFWQAHYQLSSMDPAEDHDGDGLRNGAEEIAGTDPLSATSALGFLGFDVGESPTGGLEATVVLAGISGKADACLAVPSA